MGKIAFLTPFGVLAASLAASLAFVGCDNATEWEGEEEECDTFECMVPDTCGNAVCDEGEDYLVCDADCDAAGPVFRRGLLSGEITHFPDNLLTVDDPTTDTGLRVEVGDAFDDHLETLEPYLSDAFVQLSGIDGFGLIAGAFVRSDVAINADTVSTGAESAQPGSSVIMGSLVNGALEVVPVYTTVNEGEPGIIVRQMQGLSGNRLSFLALTDRIGTPRGEKIGMDPSLFQVLHGSDPEGYERVGDDMRDVAAALVDAGYINSVDNLSSLQVFTTQDVLAKSERIADYVKAQDYEVTNHLGCRQRETWNQCTVEFRAFRYMDEDLHIDDNPDGTPLGEYTLRAEFYLPLEAGDYGEPFPTVIFGHGLGGGRGDGPTLSRDFAPEGIAVVVIDSPVHNEHPTAEGGGDQFDVIFTLFGINTSPTLTITGRTLRDGWRQSNYDKLALVELLMNGVDADDDGDVDIDSERVLYLGASLGAIQGGEFLALDTELHAWMLAVGGARITDIVRVGDIFGAILGLALNVEANPTQVDMFYIMLQTIVDAGDPGVFAPHILQDRIYGDTPRPLAAQMSVPDEIVSNGSNAFYMRALGIPLVGRVAYDIPLVPTIEAPVSNNGPSGVTAAGVQIDYVWNEGQGAYEAAGHESGPSEQEGLEYWTHFAESFLDGEAEIIDPYTAWPDRERPPLGDVPVAPVSRDTALTPFSDNPLTLDDLLH